MDNQPALGRELIIPALIGGLSIVGLIIVLLGGRLVTAPAEIAATPSSTPFQYLYLGTEPAITTLVVAGSDIAPPTDEPVEESPGFVTPTRQSFSTPPTLIVLPSLTRSATSSGPTRAATATRTSTPSAANTYDDTDSRLIYSGSWVTQAPVAGAYQETLHISTTIGNALTFTFSGQEIHFFYQAGPSLGTVTIFIDDDTLGIAVSEAQGGEWTHTLEAGTHNVLIKHTGGGSVNIDRFVFPAATPTPTRTPTPTATPTP
ncbi:MAG: hypothetical protein JW730_02335 [Anaerolineales bacterium]|nr:hypothetical protein [Anaerolineales bacterium]